MSKLNGKTLVTDLDGTICSQGTVSTYREAEPNLEVIEKINHLWSNGWKIVIFTARGMSTYKNKERAEYELRDLTLRWLNENRVCFDELIFGKPSGDYYLDDKGISINEFIDGNIR
jgi:capsule biosynthesis phosphatase